MVQSIFLWVLRKRSGDPRAAQIWGPPTALGGSNSKALAHEPPLASPTTTPRDINNQMFRILPHENSELWLPIMAELRSTSIVYR